MAHARSDDAHPDDASDNFDANSGLPESGLPESGLPTSGLPTSGLRREATSSTAQREPGSALSPQSAPVPTFSQAASPLPILPGPASPEPTFPEQRICAAYADGQSVTTLARGLGSSDVEIRKILVRHGVAIRPRGGGHDNARALAEMRVARALRPKHASAPQFSNAWFRQCDRAYIRAVLAAHPERRARGGGA